MSAGTRFDAVILGAAGYGGGELLRLLLDHPHAGSLQAVSSSHAGKPIPSAHPNLRGFLEDPFSAEPDWSALAESEHPVVFSAQPHGALAGQLTALEARWAMAGMGDRLVLVDLSGDFRLRDPRAFAEAYGGEHPCPELLPGFVYGCPEAGREILRGAQRIANPGCFATALNLALLPLAGLGIGHATACGCTGSSGSGAVAGPGTHHPTRAADVRAYRPLAHQHRGEVEALLAGLGSPLELAFVPHSVPLVRGIFLTVQVRTEHAAALPARYAAAYGDAPFVRLVEDSPRVAAVAGTNLAEVAVHVQGRDAAVLVALDNLGKGMAGQAVQNLNLALGLDERAGLWRAGRWPA